MQETLAHFLKIFLLVTEFLNLPARTGIVGGLRLRVEDDFIVPVISHFTVYVGKKWRVSLLEMFVHVDVVTLRVADLLEAIHIELSDEGSEVMMFEIAW